MKAVVLCQSVNDNGDLIHYLIRQTFPSLDDAKEWSREVRKHAPVISVYFREDTT